MKKFFKSNLILIFLIFLLTLYLLNSEIITKNILDYTKLFITKLFPSSFLIYTISSLLINYQIIENMFFKFKKPATAYVVAMSLICGFPSGPKYITELYQKNYLTQEESNYLLSFCHFPNPLFVLGAVSQILNSKIISLKILCSIIISNIIISLIKRTQDKQNISSDIKQLPFPKALNKAITESIKLQILIYGTNLFFFLISVLLTKHANLSPVPYTIINASFDLIKGIFSTTIISSTLIRALIIIAALSLGNISLHIQIRSILSDTSLNYKNFIKGRILSSIISIITFLIIY